MKSFCCSYFFSCVKASNITLFVLALLLALTSCSPNSREELNVIINREEMPGLAYKELTTIITDSAKIKYKFVAPELKQFDQRAEPTIDFPKGLHCYVFNADELIENQIKCNTAVFYQNSDLWELRDNVEAVNAKNEVFNTELLFWDRKTKRIYTDKFIKITSPTDFYQGYGFESDENMEHYSIKKLSGEFEVNEMAEE